MTTVFTQEELLKMSKADLTNLVLSLNGQVEELTRQVAARDAILGESGEEGWLITSPNPKYSGIVAGIEFRAGRAFVPASLEDAPRRVAVLVSDFRYQAKKMTAKEFKSLSAAPAEADERPEFLKSLIQPSVI